MVIPFSNTRLRVPTGFQSLLVDLSTEILRSQPRNIYEFAANYLEKSVKRREQGQSYLPDKQTSLDDRYYNNRSFRDEYPVNDPEVNNAAARIQANYRGHQTRRNIDKMKQEGREMIDADRQDLGYGRGETEMSNENEYRQRYVEDHELSAVMNSHFEKRQPIDNIVTKSSKQEQEESDKDDEKIVPSDEPQLFDKEDSEIDFQEKEVAARVIQEGYRGAKSRSSSQRDQQSPSSKVDLAQLSDRRQLQNLDNDRTATPPSTRFSEKIDSDRQDLGGNLTANDQIDTGANEDTDRPRLEREPTQLSEDFERHTQVPRNLDFDQESNANEHNDEEETNYSNTDRAAAGNYDQHPSSMSPRVRDDYEKFENRAMSPSAEENRDAESEDDNMAAVKIQAAYRGYRARKELEK